MATKEMEELMKETAMESKVIEQNRKIERAVKLFEQIRDLLPGKHISLEIHSIDVKNLDENIWEVHATYLKNEKRTYLCAERINPTNKSFDISLFD